MSEALTAERKSLVCGQGFGLGFVVTTLNSEPAFLLGKLKMNKYSFFLFFPREDAQSPALDLEATSDLGTRQGKDVGVPSSLCTVSFRSSFFRPKPLWIASYP